MEPNSDPNGLEELGLRRRAALEGGNAVLAQRGPVADNMAGDDSRIIMDRVVPFIQEHRDQPFFATVWFHAPHEPVVAGDEYRERYRNYDEAQQHLYGCITAMDEQIGRLRKTLRELEVERNTVVFFCSDNGPADSATRKGVRVRRAFPRHKHMMYEGGLLVPACAEWPSVIPKGVSTEVRCATVDYFPTIAQLTGYRFDKGKERPIDGIDLMPVIHGETTERDKDLYFGFRRLHSGVDGKAIISGEWKLLREARRDGKLKLFNLSSDPYETVDLAKDHPEQVKLLTERLTRLEQEAQLSRDGNDYRY